jgi:transposase
VPRTRPPYPKEFRREAIRLALLGDKPQRQLAKDLGISDVTLRNWLKQERAERGERPGGLSQDEREELQRLRDEKCGAADGTGDPLKGGRLLRKGERRAVGEVFSLSQRRRPTIPSP